MSKLFLDVSGNKVLVDGYQIEDSIAQKYNLKPGSICPFSGLRVEILSPQQVRASEKSERLKIIKQQRKILGKEKQKFESPFVQKKKKTSADNNKISGYATDIKGTIKSINIGESHDFARERARSGRGPARRSRTFEREEVRMATAKKVLAKPAKAAAKAPAKTKTPVKAQVKAAAKPAKSKAPAKAKVVAKKTAPKRPAKAKVKAVSKAPTKAKAQAKVKVKAKIKAPVKAKAVARKPAAKRPAKAKK
jgi:hypothetical protein